MEPNIRRKKLHSRARSFEVRRWCAYVLNIHAFAACLRKSTRSSSICERNVFLSGVAYHEAEIVSCRAQFTTPESFCKAILYAHFAFDVTHRCMIVVVATARSRVRKTKDEREKNCWPVDGWTVNQFESKRPRVQSSEKLRSFRTLEPNLRL